MTLSIKARLLLAVLGCMLGLGVAAALVVGLASREATRLASAEALASADASFAALERADVEKLDAALAALTAHPGLAEAFADRDRARLLAVAAPIFAALEKRGITHWYFVEPPPSRRYFLRVHRPEEFGDVVASATLDEAISSRGRGAGKELGKTAFALRVVRPVLRGGELVGYMGLGEEIESFLGRMREQTGDDYVLLVAKRHLDRDAWRSALSGKRDGWDDLPDAVVVSATTADAAMVDPGAALANLPERGRVLESRTRGGKRFVRSALPVLDAGGRRVGALFVQRETTALAASMTRVRLSMVGAVAAVAALLSGLLAWLTQRLVFARLERMTSTMEDLLARLAGGDYDVARELEPSGDDEIGRFERFVGQFLVVIEDLLKALTGERVG